MARYSPIEIVVPLEAGRSDLAFLQWSTNGVTLYFFLPDDEVHLLQVSFQRQCILRVLDELALSTEDTDTPNDGLVPNHLAYRVDDSSFARNQSSAWKEVNSPVTHYQLITGWTCVDVLTSESPMFGVVPREEVMPVT